MSYAVARVDLLAGIEQELANSRTELERLVDRTEALAELQRICLAVAARERRPISDADVYAGRGEEEQAAIRVLFRRAAREEEGWTD